MPDKTCSKCGKLAELRDELCAVCQSILSPTLEPTTSPVSSDSKTRRETNLSMPDQFGEYELLEEIARGGMGVVYKARHLKLNRVAALKMVLSGRFSSNDEIQRFHIEAESAARLDHPGIVPVYEIGEVDGQPFFAMKYIAGGSLAENMGSFRDDTKASMEMLAKVARAVHHAHQRGVLHRDLKPANIMLDECGEPLITDLGLAKSTTADSNLTNTGAVMGTPSYMPPEQASGGTVTTSADIYSLGAIMYQLLTGEPPHKGKSAMETVMQVLAGPPDSPSKIHKSVDRSLEAICMKCLAFETDSRYSSALQIADDLEAWLQGKPISVKSTSIWGRAQRWFRANSHLVYAAFIVLTGLVITSPFAIGFFTSPNAWHRETYSRFPVEDTPWIFSFRFDLPSWLIGTAAALLGLVFYPAIGFLNAAVARTKSMWNAIVTGLLTSFVLSIIMAIMVGWIPLAGELSSKSGRVITTLGNVVWLPEGVTEQEAREQADELFKGLKEIPVAERAEIITNRVSGDQFAEALNAILSILFLVAFFSVPVVMGTMVGHVLLQRGNYWWICLLRYFIAWWCFAIIMLLVFGLLAPNGPRFEGKPIREVPGFLLTVTGIAGLTAFLVLRRWRKPMNHNQPSSTLNNPTALFQSDG